MRKCTSYRLRFFFILSIIFLLTLNVADARSIKDSKYTYATDYKYPKTPNPIELNCSFFEDETKCQELENIPKSAQESLVLAMIKKSDPALNHDRVRFWNSKLLRPDYYEEVNFSYPDLGSDGAYGQNGSIKNAWLRLINIHPSVIDDKDGAIYIPEQVLLQIWENYDFVVSNPAQGDYCKQIYNIKGSEYELTKKIGNFSTSTNILNVREILKPSETKNLTLRLDMLGEYTQDLYKTINQTHCIEGNCTIKYYCELESQNITKDRLSIEKNITIKRFPEYFYYENKIAVPKEGFARGSAEFLLPKDFLYFKLKVKEHTFIIRKNDLKLQKRGELHPILETHLIPAASRSGDLHVTEFREEEDEDSYSAKLDYRVIVENADLGDKDCVFTLATPFETKILENACTSSRMNAKIYLRINKTETGMATIRAEVLDQLSNPVEGIEIEFSVGGERVIKKTDDKGLLFLDVEQRESTQTVIASILGSGQIAESKETIFVPGYTGEGSLKSTSVIVLLSPIFLIILIVSPIMIWLWRKRSAWLLIPLLVLPLLLSGLSHAQNTTSIETVDVAQTLEACKNYDFDNAVRHFGECAEAYRITSEFSSMRKTAVVLVENINPLIVANPDISPYREAYSNMAMISLALFRIAWAFNSLYLILNIFNPKRRHEALSQYIWLIVFVMFIYASFSVLEDVIGTINSISSWVSGEDTSQTLSSASLSAEFVVENYEMLKLVLPFMNLSYLILLARYIIVIAMILFFPFTLLLFFTSATRGFGKAALTVTFAALGLGVINSILLLIYGILVQTADPALSGSFASTFFSASFIIFFGFVNLLVLVIAFLSGSVLIGRSATEGNS
jgi:hypothetical protein